MLAYLKDGGSKKKEGGGGGSPPKIFVGTTQQLIMTFVRLIDLLAFLKGGRKTN